MAKYNSYFCKSCGKKTLFIQDSPNHVLHVLLTIFTAGIWLIVWLFVAIGEKSWHCSVCGAKPSGSGWGIAGSVYRGLETGYREGMKEADEKECPKCAETVKYKAKICRFCGHEFDDIEKPTAISPQPSKGDWAWGDYFEKSPPQKKQKELQD